MTRRLPLALATLVLSLLCTLALATPSLATESADPNLNEDSADWTGTILAVAAGFVVAGVMFLDASPGDIPRADQHH